MRHFQATVGSITLLWDVFKPVIEFQSADSRVSFIWQYIYYLFESLFDERLWMVAVESVTVQEDGRLVFEFRMGI